MTKLDRTSRRRTLFRLVALAAGERLALAGAQERRRDLDLPAKRRESDAGPRCAKDLCFPI
jgi:hypothetical protein